MIVLILERVPRTLRGELTRWMLEPRAGLFVGNVSGTVRDRLWELACRRLKGGAAMLLHTSDSEQGFDIRFWGLTGRHVIDFDGLRLLQIPK